MKNAIHPNSIKAWRQGSAELFGQRHREILAVFRASKVFLMTDREVMAALGSQDPNRVRPRITELIKSGVLAEAPGSTRCAVTGKTVRLVGLAPVRGVQVEMALEGRAT